MKTAFLFPGQGSQIVGMGKEFYDNFTVAKNVFEEVDDALNQKLSAIIFNGPIEELTLTANAQPAIMATSIAILRTLMHESGKTINDFCEYVAGHSLGEYTALCAADAFSLRDCAQIVRIRGQSMQDAVAPGIGSMAAVLGMDKEKLNLILKDISNDDLVCQIANDNCPGQIVISGHKPAIELACGLIVKEGGKAKILPVSAPFHSILMEPVKNIMLEKLQNMKINMPKVPLISNVLAAPIIDPAQIVECLIEQISGMVRWTESMQCLKKLNILHLTEVGVGKVLSGMNKRIDNEFVLNNIQSINDIV